MGSGREVGKWSLSALQIPPKLVVSSLGRGWVRSMIHPHPGMVKNWACAAASGYHCQEAQVRGEEGDPSCEGSPTACWLVSWGSWTRSVQQEDSLPPCPSFLTAATRSCSTGPHGPVYCHMENWGQEERDLPAARHPSPPAFWLSS